MLLYHHVKTFLIVKLEKNLIVYLNEVACVNTE